MLPHKRDWLFSVAVAGLWNALYDVRVRMVAGLFHCGELAIARITTSQGCLGFFTHTYACIALITDLEPVMLRYERETINLEPAE